MRYFNEGLLVPISKKTGAKYFLEQKDVYIYPKEGRFLKLVRSNGSLKL
jgi:hypothetical protein